MSTTVRLLSPLATSLVDRSVRSDEIFLTGPSTQVIWFESSAGALERGRWSRTRKRKWTTSLPATSPASSTCRLRRSVGGRPRAGCRVSSHSVVTVAFGGRTWRKWPARWLRRSSALSASRKEDRPGPSWGVDLACRVRPALPTRAPGTLRGCAPDLPAEATLLLPAEPPISRWGVPLRPAIRRPSYSAALVDTFPASLAAGTWTAPGRDV